MTSMAAMAVIVFVALFFVECSFGFYRESCATCDCSATLFSKVFFSAVWKDNYTPISCTHGSVPAIAIYKTIRIFTF